MMNTNAPEPITPANKVLVLYVFHEYNDRVKQFVKNCIFYDENVDFIVISNNKQGLFYTPEYVKVLFRDNIGYDFGGWNDALFTDNLYKKYDNFIFVNSSVVGPFLPSYYTGNWTSVYLNGLRGNVKLFGSTINSRGDFKGQLGCPTKCAHVQSYIFSMSKSTLDYLIDVEIFSKTNYATTFVDAIVNKEILVSRKIIENNWNIGSLLSQYAGVDFTFRDKSPEEYNITFFGDIMHQPYKNQLWNEYELVFIKGNRGIHE